MPIITVSSSFELPNKANFAQAITQEISQEWQVFPDKILIYFQESPAFFRAGFSPKQKDFNQKSRPINLEATAFYTVPKQSLDELILISIAAFTGFSWADKRRLAHQLTQLFKEKASFCADNIVISYQDSLAENYFQAGASGRDADFITRSRGLSQ